MITVNNEFETVDAFTHIAGCELGTRTNRETAMELINVLTMTTQHTGATEYKELAGYDDDDYGEILELCDEVAELLNAEMPMPEFCFVTLNDGEYRVMPAVEDALDTCEIFDDCPEKCHGDFILVINDHGNVTCYRWGVGDYGDVEYEYIVIWDTV